MTIPQIIMAVTGIVLTILAVAGARPRQIVGTSWVWRTGWRLLDKMRRLLGRPPKNQISVTASATVTRGGTQIQWTTPAVGLTREQLLGDRLEQLRSIVQEHRGMINSLNNLADNDMERLRSLEQGIERAKAMDVELDAQAFPLVVIGTITGALAAFPLPGWLVICWCALWLSYGLPTGFIMCRRRN